MNALSRFARLVAVLCFAPAPLYAAEPSTGAAGRNPAAAQALFEEAQQRVAAGDYEQACPKFKASYALDPGGGTLLNLADCLEKQGRTASAWSAFKDALVQAQRDGRSERVEYAQQHIRSLETKLGYLTIEVPAGSRVAELEIEVDGTPLAPAAWGSALPVDPGEHVVQARAPGFAAFEGKISLGGVGARETLLLPALRSAEQPARADETSAAPLMTTETLHPARTWGWVTGGVGLVALGVGSYFGLQAFSRWDDRNQGCNPGCTPAAKTAGDDAGRAATLATVGVGSGVVLLGVATILVLYSTDARADSTASAARGFELTASEQGASVSWKGSF